MGAFWMKSKLNSVFFGVCFLASLLAEAYSFIVLEGDLLNSIGFGLVVLITGYLLLAELRNSIHEKQSKVSYYVDHVVFEELGNWKSRLNELANIEKATYTATKKSTELLANQLKEVTNRLETLESNNSSALYLIAELQRRSLEGQKKALNIELHYNKENTKNLLTALQTVGNKIDVDAKITRILNLLEQNDEQLKKTNNENRNDETASENINFMEEAAVTREAKKEEIEAQDSKNTNTKINNIKPIYDDPNKALSSEEISALFESYNN